LVEPDHAGIGARPPYLAKALSLGEAVHISGFRNQLSGRLFGLVAPYGAIAFGDSWLPLSNAKAKAELGWTPIRR